jgi:hypothetical protein
MGKVDALLAERLKKKEGSPKMELMAKRSNQGDLTSFTGIFQVNELSLSEKSKLEEILREYTEDQEIDKDLNSLAAITSEVKAISNQAILLHGERIKRAQTLLKKYREGAFTAWLSTTYGNRQTPYNFLQYYEFVQQTPKSLQHKLETMPRQAIYTLASRNGPLKLKHKMIEDFSGETKQELLNAIRDLFPLHEADKRRTNSGENFLVSLRKSLQGMEKRNFSLTMRQKEEALYLLHTLVKTVETVGG